MKIAPGRLGNGIHLFILWFQVFIFTRPGNTAHAQRDKARGTLARAHIHTHIHTPVSEHGQWHMVLPVVEGPQGLWDPQGNPGPEP